MFLKAIATGIFAEAGARLTFARRMHQGNERPRTRRSMAALGGSFTA